MIAAGYQWHYEDYYILNPISGWIERAITSCESNVKWSFKRKEKKKRNHKLDLEGSVERIGKKCWP